MARLDEAVEGPALSGALSGHERGHSSPVSPFSTSQKAKWPQGLARKRTRDEMNEPASALKELPTQVIKPVVPTGAASGPQTKYQSADGKQYYKASLTGPGALSYLPSEMTRVKTPPTIGEGKMLGKKPSGFKGFFLDLRSLPSDAPIHGSRDDSPEPARAKRRSSIMPKRSLQSLLPKLSFHRLRSKLSRADLSATSEEEDPLAVTNFEQTPFSQRYGDARRAEMSVIRSLIDEALDSDAEGEGESDECKWLHASEFALSVPDHLPNSPLCPLNPQHQTGGKSICPLHGRRRKHAPTRSSTARSSGTTVLAGGAGLAGEAGLAGGAGGTGLTGKTEVKRGPTIVFESDDPGAPLGDWSRGG